MVTREEAQEFLLRLRSCRAKSFFGKIDESQKGVGFVLVYLEEATGEVNAGDLAKKLNVSTARIAVLLKKMEKQGLITRHNSPEDARRTVIAITPKGTSHINAVKEHILEKIQLLMEKIGKEDMEEFLRISKKIKEVLDD